jgi:hypothetical protein
MFMTSFDLIGAVELTLSAAIMIAVLSVMMGRNTSQRLKYSSVLFAWFVMVVILAATGALQYGHGIGTPGLGLAVGVPMALIWFALVRDSSLREGMNNAPLAMLVSVHVVRILGVSFLILQASHRLPEPFAPVAGWGDIVAGLAAIPVALLVYQQSRGWRPALIAWNLFGLADLMAAVILGVLSSPGPLRRIFAGPGTALMSTLPWLLIPGFLVPLLAITHLVIFYRLTKLAHVPAGRPRDRREGSTVRQFHGS